MATFDPKSRTERKDYDSVKELTNQNIKEVTPGPGGVNDRNKSTENIPTVNNPGPQPAPSDINRK